ncbi:SPV109 DNA polymerase processivity-like factor [Swinepox virus]|uniref:SPV109 DNA polymerase processivity-like factor n=1 Tax=Swinepox virus (strain Swine/Nebraska/17077-99/1999) TaxID=300880 RepID=Q8V3I6_SWPV1|nr:SPV109 DNA polymerase processivity-like factor [Swinepox virus]AAL69849.1 SPV109 DNA polymerase processivity-like factor [Swinepox virus]UED36571.1 SPV109 DNA polymerase processivity-like factor [Swinepox virus]UUA44300.1 SPV109 [Swinepox virus]
MTTLDDLNMLKDLLKLKKCLHIADQHTREKYNTLVDQATFKYWKIDIHKIMTSETSINSYYTPSKKSPFMLDAGEYVFLPMCFGNVFIYKGSMMELGSGDIYHIDDNMKSIIDDIIDEYQVDFLRFVYFKRMWILEDCFSTISPIIILKKASEKGLLSVPYLLVRVDDTVMFNDDDYNNLEILFTSKMYNIFKPESICYIKIGTSKRNIIDFFTSSYMYVKGIDLEYLGDNCYIPRIITKNSACILVKDIQHLIRSKIKKNIFVVVHKKKYFSILQTAANYTSNETLSESLCRILKDIGGNKFFINGKYLSKVNNNMGIKHLSIKLGIDPVNTIEDLIKSITRSDDLKKRIKSESIFEIVRECLEYPKSDFITLINNINFDIKNSIVEDFKLENINCLDNPNISAIYGNFNRFVSLFNILIHVKQSLS